MTYQLHHGDMRDILPMMDRDSIDAIVTDPPYGLGFMGKDWDHGVPGEHFWREAYRVAKPGAHLLAFGGTRTYHRLAVAIEDAGWEIRDCVMWVYGSGFPKSHDVSKAIDREAGAEREVIGHVNNTRSIHAGPPDSTGSHIWTGDIRSNDPITEAAREWDGWGTALKPAWEPIIVARKPLEGTVAANVQRYGTGAINVDACRIGTESTPRKDPRNGNLVNAHMEIRPWMQRRIENGEPLKGDFYGTQGRWPANLIHDGSAEVLAGFPMTTNKGHFPINGKIGSTGIYGSFNGTGNSEDRYTDDTGSAARFFYCAKASKQDRDEGCEGLEGKHIGHYAQDEWSRQNMGQTPDAKRDPVRNFHPTVKPTALMRYLCRLVTPPAGVILDPFMGSGSTGKAAILEGFNFIGCDTELEYVEIAARRIEHACGKVGIVVDQPMLFDTLREVVDKPRQMILL